MKTERLSITEENIERAGEIIRNGGLVAFPTETVYGLGADALNARAVKSVYEAKGRPSDNPMIVHISDIGQLDGLVCDVPDAARVLMDRFWPGPITFVLKRRDIIPLTTTGGLDTVGIRMPSNETARRLISAAERPIAAPSANLSGKPSPTTADDVLEDMDGRIDAVLLGEECTVGIESTVVDMTGGMPVILRPGYVTKEMIEEATGGEAGYDPALFKRPDDKDFKPKAPGMKYRHYAPDAEVRIISGDGAKAGQVIEDMKEAAERSGRKVAVIDYGRDSRAAAKDFFARLRELDREKVDLILVRALDEEELGFSVMNRMLKSAGYDIIHV